MTQEPGDEPAQDPTRRSGEKHRAAEADERIEDAEAEFGPDAPPRGASPGNPQAEEDPH